MSLIADKNIELVQCGVCIIASMYACASFCPFLFIFGIKFQKINAPKLQKKPHRLYSALKSDLIYGEMNQQMEFLCMKSDLLDWNLIHRNYAIATFQCCFSIVNRAKKRAYSYFHIFGTRISLKFVVVDVFLIHFIRAFANKHTVNTHTWINRCVSHFGEKHAHAADTHAYKYMLMVVATILILELVSFSSFFLSLILFESMKVNKQQIKEHNTQHTLVRGQKSMFEIWTREDTQHTHTFKRVSVYYIYLVRSFHR